MRNFLKEIKITLSKENVPLPRLEAEIILADALGLNSREDLLLFSFEQVELTEAFRQLVISKIQRRIEGEPLAYILGYKEFWGLSFIVSPAVLIPRPETEILLEISLDYIHSNWQDRLKSTDKPLTILDLGTGSGCIIISLIKSLQSRNIIGIGVDCSNEALKIARQNCVVHGLSKYINFFKSNWLSQVEGKFDLIICNPPYIAKEELQKLTVQRYEPNLALTDGHDGLACYRDIIKNLSNYLEDKGIILFEHGYKQRESLRNLLITNNYQILNLVDDLAGKPRVIAAKMR